MSNFKYQKEMSLVGGGTCTSLHWNDDSAFKARIVVIILIHKLNGKVVKAVDSVLNQQTSSSFSLLIIDDSMSGNWQEILGNRLNDVRIVLAKTVCGKAWKARNIAQRIIWNEFHAFEWMCRIDSDDRFATLNVIEDMLKSIENRHPKALWAISGNLLEENGKMLERKNIARRDLLRPEYVLARLKGMSEGIPDAELPSCNLWIRRGFWCHYPEMESGEDHWLVAYLLIRCTTDGCVLPDILHTVYNLSGSVSAQNKRNGHHALSRNLLYRSASFWLGYDVPGKDPICLGWGGEGAVWHQNGIVKKRFIDENLINTQAFWLEEKNAGIHLPDATWEKVDGRWQTTYSYDETLPMGEVSFASLSRFIHYCLHEQIVCLNITRRNFRSRNDELYFIDLGKDILPFEIRYFRDMCVRLYLLFVKGLSDRELTLQTKHFRNNIEAMQSIEGFEDFFHREIQLWIQNSGIFAKPFRELTEPKHYHEDITMMIKCCAMESEFIEQNVHHILQELCEKNSFAEIVMLIDSNIGPFQRQYTQGNLDELMQKVNGLADRSVIDRMLISPGKDQTTLIRSTLFAWFGQECEETHAGKGSPVFPQVWAFEQIGTRYLLQIDADAIIHMGNNHNAIGEMKEALQKEKVFSVGFNIPQAENISYKEYDAPPGKYVPEIRFCLLDLKRMMEKRPFPNEVRDGKLVMNWHRSVEQCQSMTGWRSLRGGDSRPFFIHPQNSLKQDVEFLERAVDLTEQNRIPSQQRSQWDLTGTRVDWKYDPRDEPIIVLLFSNNPILHWARGAIMSLVNQHGVDWGAIIIDDCSGYKYQHWLQNVVARNKDHITLVRKRFTPVTAESVHDILSEVCVDPNQLIIRAWSDEVLFTDQVLKNLCVEIKPNHTELWGPTYFISNPLGFSRNTLNKIDVGNIDQYNVQIALRGIRFREIQDPTHAFLNFSTIHGGKAVSVTDHSLLFPSYLFYCNRYFNGKVGISTLRPTTYIPNLRRMEIDITYKCNLRCSGCCRSCSQAPSDLHMPIEMIHEFIQETEQKGIKWESVHILGGEPTLHPQFQEIISVLDDWFERFSPSTDMKVISNGTGSVVNEKLKKIPERWLYDKSFKRSIDTSYFEPFNIAPIDMSGWKDEDFRKGCYITQDSGIGLTPFGYYHCAIAGGIERIMQLGFGLENIPSHPWNFTEMMHEYCRYCGHFLNDTYQTRTNQKEKGISPSSISESWKQAYRTWSE